MKKVKVVQVVEAMLGGIRQHVIDIVENLDTDKYENYLIYSPGRADKGKTCCPINGLTGVSCSCKECYESCFVFDHLE